MNKTILIGGAIGVASMALAGSAAVAKPETRVRDEIPAKYRWDFSAIYADWNAWEAGMREMEVKMDAFAALKGSLSKGPDAVLKAYAAFS